MRVFPLTLRALLQQIRLRCLVLPLILLIWTSLLTAQESAKENLKKQGEPYKSEYDPKDNKPAEEVPLENEAEKIQLDKNLDCFKAVEDLEPVRSADKNEDEHFAYNYILEHARKFSTAALARNSLRNIPYANFVDDIRQDYRYDLIHVEGRIDRIDLMKPTEMLAKASGVKQLYEIWLFPLERANQENPICLVTSEIPEGIKTGRHVSYWVEFDAYYFKLMKYESGQKLANNRYQWRKAPLLLGKTFRIVQPPEQDGLYSFRGGFVPAVVTVIGVVGFTALGIAIYYRRGDRKVREQLEQIRGNTNPFENAPPPSEWLEHS